MVGYVLIMSCLSSLQWVALTALLDNLPLNFASKPGFQYFFQQLLGEKRFPTPSEDAVAKSIVMLHESTLLATKDLLQKTKSVCIAFLFNEKHICDSLERFARN